MKKKRWKNVIRVRETLIQTNVLVRVLPLVFFLPPQWLILSNKSRKINLCPFNIYNIYSIYNICCRNENFPPFLGDRIVRLVYLFWDSKIWTVSLANFFLPTFLDLFLSQISSFTFSSLPLSIFFTFFLFSLESIKIWDWDIGIGTCIKCGRIFFDLKSMVINFQAQSSQKV